MVGHQKFEWLAWLTATTLKGPALPEKPCRFNDVVMHLCHLGHCELYARAMLHNHYSMWRVPLVQKEHSCMILTKKSKARKERQHQHLSTVGLATLEELSQTCKSAIHSQQRQVIRILWMVPVYGLSTFVSLVSLNTAFYVDTFRDIYEAFVIYAFFNLLLNKLGGERALIIMLHSRPPSENFFPGSLYSRDIYVGDPYTFLFVKRGILQFVYVKPLLAFVTMALKATGNYHDGDLSWSSSYLYLTFVYNLSVCLSLWCLMVFFYATKHDLAGFRPFPKFLCVKAIIFFSFWQSVIIAILVSSGAILDDGSGHVSVAIQDFLICMEMVPFAVAHAYAFSYDDYHDPTVHSARMPILSSIKDSFGLKDVMMDTLDTLRGSKFNYKSFEPSEGMPHFGSSRTSRIMAGLRYSSSSSTKRWLQAAPVSRFLSTGPGINDEVVIEESEQLVFDDPCSDDVVEEYYTASRSMQFGDYNYPVIDFRSPLWGGYIKQQHRTSGYGGTASSGGGGKQLTLHQYSAMEERPGCMDVIVEQGKGNYVVIDYSHSESSTIQQPQHHPQIQVSHSSPFPYQHGSVLAVTAPSSSISSASLVSPIPTASSSASVTINQPQAQAQDYSYPHSYQAQLKNTHHQMQEGYKNYNDDLLDYDHAGDDDDNRDQDDMFTTSNVWK